MSLCLTCKHLKRRRCLLISRMPDSSASNRAKDPCYEFCTAYMRDEIKFMEEKLKAKSW